MVTSALSEIDILSQQIKTANIPEKLAERIQIRLDQLSKLVDSQSFLPEFDRINKYIEWVLEMPWNKKTQDNLDLENAKRILDKNHFGLDEIKNRILEYMSVMKLKLEKGEMEDLMSLHQVELL